MIWEVDSFSNSVDKKTNIYEKNIAYLLVAHFFTSHKLP